METRTLAFEIGTEEIPAFDLSKATVELGRIITTSLEDAGIVFGTVSTYSSPRRLIAYVEGVQESTEAINLELKGPSKKIAFDADGNPTKAAIGFARGKGIDVDTLVIKEDGGIEYVYALIDIPSKQTAELLPEMLRNAIDALSWPKSMRWSTYREVFSRPVRWIVALFGSEVIPFDYAGISSGAQTCGHRYLAPGPFTLSAAEDLIPTIRRAFVVPTEEERRQVICDGVDEIVKALGEGFEAKLPEKTLLEVTNLSEYPTPMLGTFDEEFLQVPEEIIVDAMLMHQRYFPIYKDGVLTNKFVIVSNGDPAHTDLIVDGNERVVAARLYDAKFFYDEDLKLPLEAYIPHLDDVVFQEKLGTMRMKTARIVSLAEKVCLDAEITEEESADISRAALLCKADLVTNAVIEFTSVQGVMGSYYAHAAGEREPVACAIADHYKPRFAGDTVPQNIVGKIVAFCDKLDTICGLFAIDQAPTGSSDPFGLRRAALGIIAILQSGLDISLCKAVADTLDIYEQAGVSFDRDAVQANVSEFFIGRTKVMLRDEGNPADAIEAILASGIEEPIQIIKRTRALVAVRKEQPESFEDLATAYARAYNLRDESVGTDVDRALFNASEQVLSDAIERVSTEVSMALEGDDYACAFEKLSTLREPIDNFFDATMVMDEDPALRANHLRLLNRFVALFTNIADFSKLAGGK